MSTPKPTQPAPGHVWRKGSDLWELTGPVKGKEDHWYVKPKGRSGEETVWWTAHIYNHTDSYYTLVSWEKADYSQCF